MEFRIKQSDGLQCYISDTSYLCIGQGKGEYNNAEIFISIPPCEAVDLIEWLCESKDELISRLLEGDRH